MPAVRLTMYVYLDSDFAARFGDAHHGGRRRINDWLWQTERQMRTEYPLSLRLAGVGTWQLPPGANDGKRIFEKYAPRTWPASAGANCLVAMTGRKSVYWSGISRWPRIFLKAQAAQPVDEKTVAMLCHEISHWFGAIDIIDASFPERTVMNYRDARFGTVSGRVVWDQANRQRMMRAISSWKQ